MRTIGALSDRLLNLFAPKTEASGLWIWQTWCTNQIICNDRFRSIVRCYCHDGSGYCYNCTLHGCC